MSTYVVGDVQGCFDALSRLLDKIGFVPQNDTLWLCGDLVNRGPDSLATLRFIQSLGNAAVVVLGNHDLHCLARYYGHTQPNSDDTLESLLQAPDAEQLMSWLRQQKLCHYDADYNTMMVHAGIAPSWSLADCLTCAQELSAILRGDAYDTFLATMYGDSPITWSPTLAGQARWRYIANVLTRIRYCDTQGRLRLELKSTPDAAPDDCVPWYACLHTSFETIRICFGHWAALRGVCPRPHIFALDTGCVWGGELTAIRLEDNQRFCVH